MQPSTRSCVGGLGGVGSRGTGGGSGGRGGRCDWRLPVVVGRGTMCCFGLLSSRTGLVAPRSGCLASAGATEAPVVGLEEKTVVGFMLAAWRRAAASSSSAVAVLAVGGGGRGALAALSRCAKKFVWAVTCGTAAGASS